MGPSYRNEQRFTGLQGGGNPLWEFKESDHCLYCEREVQDGIVKVVLFNGWIEDKAIGSGQESNEIMTASSLLAEYLIERRSST